MLGSLCRLKDSPWAMLSGDFTTDGHVSIDMVIQTRCGSLRVCVEADGECGWVRELSSVPVPIWAFRPDAADLQMCLETGYAESSDGVC